jgi:hypothetical protein
MLSGLFLMCGQMIKAIEDNLQLVLDGVSGSLGRRSVVYTGRDGTLPAL